MIGRLLRDHPYFAAFLGAGVALALFHLLLVSIGGPARADDTFPRILRLVYLLACASFAALALAKRMLALEWAPLAVARTVVDEALRMKIAVVFVGLLLVCLAGLPFTIDSGSSALRYRVQTLIHYGLTATSSLLSLMTVFLACGTLSHEIQDQRIFTTLSKPIGRGPYLLGKWFGLLMLNTALLAVAGCAIHVAVRWMSSRQALDVLDRNIVDTEVLTARVSVNPEPPKNEFEQRVRERIEKLKAQAPDEYGDTPAKQREKERQIRADVEKQWFSIPPQRSASYVFRGLDAAKRLGEPVQLRFKLNYLGKWAEMNEEGQKVRRRFQVNGRDLPPLWIVLGRFQMLKIPAEVIDDRGEVRLTVFNNDPEDPERLKDVTLIFARGAGLEALYRADSFGGNFWRALGMVWVKLAFLAILGLTAATFLGFPVACLISLAVLVSAWISGFLMMEIHRYGVDYESAGAQGLAWAIRTMVTVLAGVLRQYARFSPAEQVADGRLVPWSDLFACLAWIGIGWCGLTGLLGWLIFRMRELGRVQV